MMKKFFFYIYTVIANILPGHIIFTKELTIPDDANLDFPGLARKYGHPSVQFDVFTEDDYVLTLFRLPGRGKIPILLMHGILDSADTFMLRGNNSIAITLANLGYDVWLGNCRGNRYSRRHRFLDPSKESIYWDFSFHEMGYYDLPAFIDTILKEAEASTLTAIGHSQGNTIFYVMGSTRPEYNLKINVMIALAPVCYLHDTTSPVLKLLINIAPILHNIFLSLNIHLGEFFGYESIATRFLRILCKQPTIGYHLCMTAFFFHTTGYDPEELDMDFANLLIFHYPTGTSLKDFLHFVQIEKSRKFRRYDFGRDKNMREYNSTSSPMYDLSKVTMPVALLAAKNDPLSTLANVDILRKQLPNVVYYLINKRTEFNHVDHVWARSMQLNSFNNIMRVLSKYNPA